MIVEEIHFLYDTKKNIHCVFLYMNENKEGRYLSTNVRTALLNERTPEVSSLIEGKQSSFRFFPV